MKIFFIKRKGKLTAGNMSYARLLVFADQSQVYCDLMFYRKKDAKKYLSSFKHSLYFEIYGVEI